ncbi:DUF308 domain-containing protein [Numidum massiliense]|uniref:DUF308 domain-containing protein n=1 Tax=Numidum massiliense TaxID=1522315 RepID=UPI0006D53528|nr:DUF308 domain-containing protein [Numidum massiliense]
MAEDERRDLGNDRGQGSGRKVVPYTQRTGLTNKRTAADVTEKRMATEWGPANAKIDDPIEGGDDAPLRNLDANDIWASANDVRGYGTPATRDENDRSDDNNRHPLDDVGLSKDDFRSLVSDVDDVETAQELTANDAPVDGTEEKTGGNGLGVTGLILSLVSIFIYPIIFAPAGMIVGYFAFRSGARTSGMWAIAISALALLMAVWILPAFYR